MAKNKQSNVAIEDLEVFDDEFIQTEVDVEDNTPLPDGRYQMAVDRVELLYSQNGNPMLVWHMHVTGPTHVGRKFRHRNMIVTKENIRWLKHDLVVAGLKLQKLSELPERLNDLLDVRLEVQLKTKGEHQNCYFNKRLANVEPRTVEGDDDVPF